MTLTPQLAQQCLELIDFLHGSAPLDGVWFGDKHPTERGAFWWRKRLSALRESLASGEGDGASQAARDVLAERKRQIGAEGWTPEHDDQHGGGVLAEAGACYAVAFPHQPLPMDWPWEVNWWKPKDRRSNLVRGAALTSATKEQQK